MSDCGVMVGVIDEQMPIFDAWLRAYKLSGSKLPLTFAYFGSDAAVEQRLRREGEVILCGDAEGNGWMRKPWAIQRSTYKTTVWLDLDTEVRGPLERLVEKFQASGKRIAAIRDRATNEFRIQPWAAAHKDVVFLDTGCVMVSEAERDLLERWRIECLKEEYQTSGDHVALSLMLAREGIEPYVFADTDATQCLPVFGLVMPYYVRHWAGSAGKAMLNDYLRGQAKRGGRPADVDRSQPARETKPPDSLVRYEADRLGVMLVTYNRPKHLLLTLWSFERVASGLNWEMVIVQNDRLPDTLGVIREFQARHEGQVTSVTMPSNMGKAFGQNCAYGLLAQRHDGLGKVEPLWFLLCDDDTFFRAPLVLWLEVLKNSPGAGGTVVSGHAPPADCRMIEMRGLGVEVAVTESLSGFAPAYMIDARFAKHYFPLPTYRHRCGVVSGRIMNGLDDGWIAPVASGCHARHVVLPWAVLHTGGTQSSFDSGSQKAYPPINKLEDDLCELIRACAIGDLVRRVSDYLQQSAAAAKQDREEKPK